MAHHTSRSARHLTALVSILLLSIHLLPAPAQAEVDESKLDLRVIEAFPKLQWPDDVTGADQGLARDPRPIVITGAGDGSNRIFVATQYGTIHYFDNDPNAEEMALFLDIRDRQLPFNGKQNEEGFLGLALHPEFEQNGQFFVYYTSQEKSDGKNVSYVSRFNCPGNDRSKADPQSEEVLMRIPQPFWNHNGGTIVFGPDGYLYVGLGDGGAANDPNMNGQNLQTWLGSILRIDVDQRQGNRPYGIPEDNPYVGMEKYARPEIWANGIRNVWRMSFDRETGTCWAGDVGQDLWEEIDIIVGGGNYGWNHREAMHGFAAQDFQPSENLIDPIWEYHHDVGKSITGGHVYRGKRTPELVGGYVYADYVTGQVWGLWYDHDAEQVTANRTILPSGPPVITFGEDDKGEIYFSSERQIFTFARP